MTSPDSSLFPAHVSGWHSHEAAARLASVNLTHDIFVLRARSIVTMAGEQPARGRDLFQPLTKVDNGQIIINNGIITEIGKKGGHLPAGAKILDLGDVLMAPPMVNAHTHLQLSWLTGKLRFQQGFTPWLKSMVPEILNMLQNGADYSQGLPALRMALEEIKKSGTILVGDVGGSLPHAASAIWSFCQEYHVRLRFFCEWFGFAQNDPSFPWTPRCADEMRKLPDLRDCSAPAGHALYSTAPETLQRAKAWCDEHGKVFSMHLAESPEETELLACGSGRLKDFYQDIVLPKDWLPPHKKPLAYACGLELLDSRTLAVHGCQLDQVEIPRFAQTGASLCLCPRSNRNLGVGLPPVSKYMEAGVLLCLGTDGLSSNHDLNVAREGDFLMRNMDIPGQAVLRMLTINGAKALGQNPDMARIMRNNSARFSLWDPAMPGLDS